MTQRRQKGQVAELRPSPAAQARRPLPRGEVGRKGAHEGRPYTGRGSCLRRNDGDCASRPGYPHPPRKRVDLSPRERWGERAPTRDAPTPDEVPAFAGTTDPRGCCALKHGTPLCSAQHDKVSRCAAPGTTSMAAPRGGIHPLPRKSARNPSKLLTRAKKLQV